MENKVTVVVTGFGPFGMYETNPSWEAVKLLPDLFKTRKESLNVNLIIAEVPVAYDEVSAKVKDLHEKHNPSIIVHVGVSGAAKCLTIESQACTKGYNRPDIYSKYPEEKDVDYAVLKSNCKIDEICEIINKNSSEIKCEATPSDNAGKYLCEYIYYKSLALGVPQVLFVHVPESYVYTYEQTARGLLKIVLYLIECTLCV